MTTVSSVSWFIDSQEDVDFVREFIEGYHFNVQLAFYERKHVDDWLESFIDFPVEYISSVHLPKGLSLDDYNDSSGVVERMRQILKVNRFVVHPWASDLEEIVRYVDDLEEYTLCLENFAPKNKQGSPMMLLAQFGKYFMGKHVGLCVDFSHLGAELGNYTFVKGLLPFTKMLHISDKVGRQSHCPMFRAQADVRALHLLGQIMNVKELTVEEAVLEYGKQNKKELCKHIFWLVEFVTRKRKRWRKKDG